MIKPAILLVLFLLIFPSLNAQVTFPNLTEKTFGTDQELVNGILLSNKYWLIGSQPYFFEGKFREGTVNINDQRTEKVLLRYNLYSQRVEINFQNVSGNWQEFESVPQFIPSFSFEGFEFRYMHFPNENPAYYQEISDGKITCYISWMKKMEISHERTEEFKFGKAIIRYWLKTDENLITFHNRKTFIKSLPEMRHKEASKLLNQLRFYFKEPTPLEIDKFIKAALPLYETDSTQ